ncbi:proline dehydrogenase family protein [Spirosoma koreense]
MHTEATLSFENTAQAFVYKSDKQLKKTHYLFQLMNQQWLVKMGIPLTMYAVKWNLPVTGLIRSTIFEQFVGGETLDQTTALIDKLQKYNIDVILDYGAEGKETEVDFNKTKDEFIRVINHSATHANVPLIGIKLTALARFTLLEKLNKSAVASGEKIELDTSQLSPEEKQEWERVVQRVVDLCELATKKTIGILIDAEESWIQNTIDALTMQLMQRYNQQKFIIYNTVQLYRHDRLDFLKYCFELAQKNNFLLGVKIVRGAYMEKERRRSAELNEQTVIQADKAASDDDFNEAINFCISHIDTLSVIIASHNENSALLAVRLLTQAALPLNHPHVQFSQLYGMSDNITFNLAKIGCHVSKYLPYGPIQDVIPYLMRRAQENSSVAGQTSRELFLIEQEMKRRGL